MSLAVVRSRAQAGIAAPPVHIEVHITNGLPALTMVGLPEAAVRESKDRVRSALINSRFEFPLRRITVNLAPADLPKDGTRFDLPIALGILAASGQIPTDALAEHEFIGELALNGELRPVKGVLPVSLQVREAGARLVLPEDNAEEAVLVRGQHVLPARNLLAVCAHLNNSDPIGFHVAGDSDHNHTESPDLAEVRGQYQAKRALEVAAAGGHNLLMIGPPGTGKSMLASRLPGILPPMTEQEAIESATVQSISHQGFSTDDWGRRPFRSPHHTASGVALVGGGSQPRPGEISLAHHGVLFLDELPEFERRVLEVLREPMETGRISISRAARQETFPARFQLIAAMNPCPSSVGNRDCPPHEQQRYLGRISGPMLDRFDIQIEVPRVSREQLYASAPQGEDTATVRERVATARQRQVDRGGMPNSHLAVADIDAHCVLGTEEQRLLEAAVDRLGLSTRGWHRVLKVALTIADLAGHERISAPHLSEALTYRSLERRAGGVV